MKTLHYDHNKTRFLITEREVTDQQLRDEGPIHWSTAWGGFWVAASSQLVAEVLRDPILFHSGWVHYDGTLKGGVLIPGSGKTDSVATDFDPPEHTFHRSLFKLSCVGQERASAMDASANMAYRLLCESGKRGEFCLVKDVTQPVVSKVVYDMLGLHPIPETLIWDRVALAEYLSATKRDDARFSKVLRDKLDGDTDLMANVISTFYCSGIDSTVALASWMAATVLSHDVSTVPVEDLVDWCLLRYSPVSAVARTVAEEAEVHGARLRAGDRILACIASANDEARSMGVKGSAFAFGHGPHRCPGASVARSIVTGVAEAVKSYKAEHRMTLLEITPYDYGTLNGLRSCAVTVG